MTDVQPPGWFRTWIATLVKSTSMFGGVGISLGAILYLLAPYFGASSYAWFFAGAAIPPGMMALYFASDRRFERRLTFLKRMRDKGYIPPEEYDQAVKQAMKWWLDTVVPIRSEHGTQANPKKRKAIPKTKPEHAGPPEIPEIDPDESPTLEPPVTPVG